MRWIIKVKPHVPFGTRKEKSRFALLPRRIDGYWVWLERYKELYTNVSYDRTLWCWVATILRKASEGK